MDQARTENGWITPQPSAKEWIEWHWCSQCRLIVQQKIIARNVWATKFLALCLKDGNQLNEVS